MSEQVQCPSCDETFDTEHGRNIHHTTVHGESLTQETGECDYCGEEFDVPPGSTGVYCSNECQGADLRDRVELVCDHCDEAFQAKPQEAADGRRFCSRECYAASMEERSAYECAGCGRDYSVYSSAGIRYCSRACMAEDRTSAPRPDDLDGVLWVLYVYEDNNARDTWLRANHHADEWLTQEETKERLKANDWMADDGSGAKYEHLTVDDVGLEGEPDAPDESWEKYYRSQRVGGDA